MKIFVNFLTVILLAGCGQSNCESSKSEKMNSSDSLLKTLDNLYIVEDSLILNDLDSALAVPEKVMHLIIEPREITTSGIIKYSDLKHLPSQLGKLANLKILEIHCLEKLQELPIEIGQLEKLEKLTINNGNGCVMNISIPSSIRHLRNLKELTLYGAMDASLFIREDSINNTKNPLSIIKYLPDEISELKNLEVLDLGRNRIDYFPSQIKFLTKLKILRLEYSSIKEIPAYISLLKDLEEIDLSKNGHVKFPDSLGELKNLKIKMADNGLTIKEQKDLKNRFPNVIFDFKNDYGGNEEPTQ